jgi:PBP1b-binding outer membrane lipoprotein LpoB
VTERVEQQEAGIKRMRADSVSAMTTDIVKRLRDRSQMVYEYTGADRQLDAEAADEIVRLRNRVARLEGLA